MICRTLCAIGALYPLGDFVFFRDTRAWKAASWALLVANLGAWAVYFGAYRSTELRVALEVLAVNTIIVWGWRCVVHWGAIKNLNSTKQFWVASCVLAVSITRPVPAFFKGVLVASTILIAIGRLNLSGLEFGGIVALFGLVLSASFAKNWSNRSEHTLGCPIFAK